MRIDFEMAQVMAERRMDPLPDPGVWPGLLDALTVLADGKAELVRHTERSWASVTFSGTRHSAIFTFSGDDAVAAGERFVAALPDHEFAILGQLVADAAVTAAHHGLLPVPRLQVETEFLLLEEA